MNKKILYGALVVLVVAAGVVVWRLYYAPTSPKEQGEATPTEVAKTAAVADTAQTSAGSAMEKANPFSANVNPVEGYKNPFE